MHVVERPAIPTEPEEGLVEIDGLDYYAIPHVDRMAPFLMSVVSDGDRWMFASSSGALTAGRRDAAHAVFPYETDDRLHQAGGRIGPVTLLRVGDVMWQPFAPGRAAGSRHLFKAVTGDSLIFEEHHDELGLLARYRWASCDRFGFVRTVTLTNVGPAAVTVGVLDGLVDVLPAGLDPVVTQRLSNLANAYKRSELVSPRLAVFSLESPVSDRAEPEEVLRATTVWSTGLEGADVTLDADRVARFRRGDDGGLSAFVTGRPGAYLLDGRAGIGAGDSVTWRIVIDADREPADVVELRRLLDDSVASPVDLDAETSAATSELVRIMARADAAQCTGDEVATAHHVANVTYNVMRGGVPLHGYRIDRDDLARFVAQRNRPLADAHTDWFRSLPDDVDRNEVVGRARTTGDLHLLRLVREYLPFSFSRRHGDPSRPWNTFSIRVRDVDGEPVLHYEGNWRDVFQNWEALCATHPHYLPGVVSVFVDASTADGYNPYRITRDGIDWEVPDPHDPWANIGYWGDHQIVYLHRLLEMCERYLPGTLESMATEDGFTFADVPYRLAPYEQLLDDPKATITYDEPAAARSAARVERVGGDGRLLVGDDGHLVTTTLLEKLLIPALGKLGNFVPGAGIWMNTQRPEWNDANNALVGYGASMVTLYHLRQYLIRLRALATAAASTTPVTVSQEVASWLRATSEALTSTPVVPADGDSDRHRKALLDRLGRAASDHRWAIYEHGLSGERVELDGTGIEELCDAALAHLDETIRTARRDDGLYHAYRVLRFAPDGDRIEVETLDPMLEGQVAVLNCGALDAAEQLQLVEALFASPLYRPDQRSFLLAPVRQLPSFLDKGIIPESELRAIPLLRQLVAHGDQSVVRADGDGTTRFHPDLVDESRLATALDRLAADQRWSEGVGADRHLVLALYDRIFRHRSYLGRSGSMYAYEGIGSIYWHMVTKLLLAVQEAVVTAVDADAPADVVDGLARAYWRVRAGLGAEQTAEEFGAVPTDPYSHTPSHAGAQQPGMTGAVKEELLARPLELGVRVRDGSLVVDPCLLRRSELSDRPLTWRLLDQQDRTVEVELPERSVGLTVCQVPVIVVSDGGATPGVRIDFADGTSIRSEGHAVDPAVSSMIFRRTGEVTCVRATLGRS